MIKDKLTFYIFINTMELTNQ